MEPIPFESGRAWRPADVDGVVCARARFRRHRFRDHVHSAFGVAVVVSGAHAFRCRGAEHVATRGSLITINPGELHDGRAPGTSGYELRSMLVEPEVLEGLGRGLGQAWGFERPIRRAPALARRFSRAHARLESEPDEAAGAVLRGQLLLEVVAEAVRLSEPRRLPGPATASERRARRAAEWMRENLGRRIALVDIAAAVELSPFHFLRTFKRCFGVTPHAYLSWLRLERGRERLLDGSPPVQVASEVGFSDQSHFTRCFRRAFGYTPAGLQRTSRVSLDRGGRMHA